MHPFSFLPEAIKGRDAYIKAGGLEERQTAGIFTMEESPKKKEKYQNELYICSGVPRKRKRNSPNRGLVLFCIQQQKTLTFWNSGNFYVKRIGTICGI